MAHDNPSATDEGSPPPGRVDLVQLEAGEVPASEDGRCAVVQLVVAGEFLALVRCSRLAAPDQALCQLHRIHVGAG